MYKRRQHFLPGAEKPELTPKNCCMRVKLATELLACDCKTIVFINEANIRSDYGAIPRWHSLEERYHLDVKQSTTKQAYSKGEFLGAIKYGEPPGPFRIFLTETPEEREEAEELLDKLRKEEEPRLRTEFNAQEAEKNVS